MSPPEIWGPAVWLLFHTLSGKIDVTAYSFIYVQLFHHIRNISSLLPCPECSKDALKILNNININDLKTNTDFINFFYLFHNQVNHKKNKSLFNYQNINVYNNVNLIHVLNNFANKYNTKGNMKLLNESFQRQFVLKNFNKWISVNINAFMKPMLLRPIYVKTPETDEPKTSLQVTY
jgi:hypothetical protein